MICSVTKGVLLNYITILFPKYFTLGKEALCNTISLELHESFDFQPITYSAPLPIFNSNTLNVGS